MNARPLRKELFRIEIIAFSDGTIDVNAPLDSKCQCYGMLEVARDVVKDHKPDAVQIVPASALSGGR